MTIVIIRIMRKREGNQREVTTVSHSKYVVVSSCQITIIININGLNKNNKIKKCVFFVFLCVVCE